LTTVTADSSTGSADGPNIGAIVGGVVGGVAVIAIIVYCVWRFVIKPRRAQYEEEYDTQYGDDGSTEKDFMSRRAARSSTHTVHSIASTVLTRASNIIQIAYIPGVTNRSAPSTPGLLVPPVPPIPIALSNSSSPGYEDQHFFLPGDIRDSTYSAMTDRTSYAPRSSIASTIYGKHAVVSPIPAQTVMRAKAAMVSVGKSNANSPGDLTPPVPAVNYGKYQKNNRDTASMQPPPSPAFSVGSTFLNSATTATSSRPTMVRVNTGQKSKSVVESVEEEPADSDTGTLGPGRQSAAITIIDDTTPMVDQGPFSDPPKTPKSGTHKKSGSLSAVIEEATRRASDTPKGGLATRSLETPFGDENATSDKD
jgi:hypothetical protein